MEFDEITHKVKWWLLEKGDVATAYIPFLLKERKRHISARRKSRKEARQAESLLSCLLWKSEVERQKESVDEIDTLIQEVKHWHQI